MMGAGDHPDFFVVPGASDVATGRDAVLTRAIEIIRKP